MGTDRGRIRTLWVTATAPVSDEGALADHGIELLYASTIPEAIATVEDGVFDAVVVSAAHADALVAVSQLSTATTVPVLYVEAGNQPEALETALDRGATATVSNALPETIANRVRRTVRSVDDRRDARLFEQFLSGLHLDTGDTVFFKDEESRFVRVSETKAREVGESRSEVRGKSDFDHMPDPEARDRYEEEQRIMETGESIVGKEERLATPEGVTWYRVTKLPRYDENGEIVGTFGLSRDISELKELEETLSELEAAVDRVPVWLLAVDAEGKVTWANEPARRNLVGEEGRILEQPLVDESATEEALVDGFGEQFDTAIGTLMGDSSDVEGERADPKGVNDAPADANGRPHERYVSHEVQIDPIDGDSRICDIHVRLLPLADGAYNGAVLAFHDVTAQVENERELRRQNERLERLVHTISHDLRNPLQVASGYVESAAAEFESDLVTGAANALERMDELVDDLLSMAHEGREPEDPELVSVEAVARRAWRPFEEESATLEIDGAATIDGDPDRLVRLFENCFRNSVEHGIDGTETGGDDDGDDVTVRVGPIHGGGFYVADDGPGIPDAERGTIFDHGYTTSDEGTGFGLAIVEEIARAHGFEAAASESQARGARLEFTPDRGRIESAGTGVNDARE